MHAEPAPPSPTPEALAGVIELSRYPIFDPEAEAYRAQVERSRAELAESGCSVLPGFFTAAALARLQAEATELAPRAYVNDIVNNAYSTRGDPQLPDDHPINLLMERTNAFVPKAEIPSTSAIRALYHAAPFQRFVAACLGEPVIYEYADPLAGLVLNVLYPGRQHPWHYDTNEFIVSTLLQAGEHGGSFEYCPNIRSPHEENYEQVSAVIRGEDRSCVRTLDLQPGDLQLFRGRFALHRVTRPAGARARITGIFAYAKRPNVVGKPERTRQLFGQVCSVHLEAAEAQRRDDGLTD